MITNLNKRLLIGLSFIICHLSLSVAVAADYVDDINNAANNEAGHYCFTYTANPLASSATGVLASREISVVDGASWIDRSFSH